MTMIGITGVTGHLGAIAAKFVAAAGRKAIHLARSPEKAPYLPGAEVRKVQYANTTEVVTALTGIETLLFVSARESEHRVSEHKAFLDAAKTAGVKHIVYTSFYGASNDATFTLARDHAQTERYIKDLGFTYTFLRDNFYLEFFQGLLEEYGEIRGPAGQGRVSAVARQDTAEVAATILLNAKSWANQTLNLTGPEDLSMEDVLRIGTEVTGENYQYIDETLAEAYESRKQWPAQQWEYDSWVSTYTAIAAGEQAGLSSDVERVLGRPPKSLKDVWLREDL